MNAVSVVEESFASAAVQALLDEWNDEINERHGYVEFRRANVAVSDFVAPDGAFFTALLGDAVIGCGGLRRLTAPIGEVKRLFVRQNARGHGAGRALLVAIERHAKGLGIEQLRLDTNSEQALRLFRSLGYQPIPDYNSNPYAHDWLEKSITGFAEPGGAE
jgi:N-acetylglutamate synthase-like GNAT family acetyltransferase